MIRELAYRMLPGLLSHIAVRLGRYEKENVRTLRSLVRPGMIAWDVGANVGQMTHTLSRFVGKRGHVVAVEPGPRNAATLRHYVSRRITVIEAAVSDSVGYAYLSGDGRSDARLNGFTAQATRVRTVTLDHLLEMTHQSPSLVKMDIEGHELPAFRGATTLLREARPILVVEFHGEGLKAPPYRDVDTEARALVESFGYTWIAPPLDQNGVPAGWHVAMPQARAGSGPGR